MSGTDKESVVIDRHGQIGTVVTMGKNSSIENITVKGGNYGIVIPKHKKSTIRNCSIEKAGRIGVWIKRSNTLLENSVDIWDSTISDNTKKGVYAESRFIYFINNKIENNGEEGIDLRSKMKGTISKNLINSNGEGGTEIEVRNVALEISNNSLNQNGSNGITINNRTNKGGKVIIKDNQIQQNLHYGIRCTGTKKWTKKLWKNSIKTSKNTLIKNRWSNIAASCHSK